MSDSKKLSTVDIKIGGGNTPKTLDPGNHLCKINSIILEEFKLKPGSYHVILHLEGEDMGPDFEGFFLDKDNESLGRYKGKVAKLKLTQWAFSDGTTKSGIEVSRDTEMLKAIKQLCINLGCMNWLGEQEGKHETIESFYTAFNKDAPFKDLFYNFCITGKEYTNKSGFPAYDLFLPKYSKDGVSIEPQNVTPSKLLKFNDAIHIERKKTETVNEFGNDQTISKNASSDLISNKDADFEL